MHLSIIIVTFSIVLKTLKDKSYGMTTPENQRDNQSDFEVVVTSSDWISESGMSEDTPLFANVEDKRPVVKDGYRKVWIVFYMLGMTTLLPWNFFIAVNDYWNYKFGDVDNTTTISSSSNLTRNRTNLQKQFTSYLAIASNIPNALFVILNVIYGRNFRLNVRIMGSLTVMATLFIAVLIMTRIDSHLWQEWFLASTLLIVVFLNICTAVFQGGLVGVAGKFPSKYMGGMMSGQALGGIFPALVNVAVIALKVRPGWRRQHGVKLVVSGQPGEHWLLLLPGGIPLCHIQPGGLHGYSDDRLLPPPRRHRGPGGPHHHSLHRDARLRLHLQTERGLVLEISAQRLLDISLLADCLPQRDSPGGESVQELW